MVKDQFDFKLIEEKWKKYWQKNGIYTFDGKSSAKIFSVDTPPPTVSGEMHIGHACSYSQQDFIARFKRMVGYNVFYPFGTDDNGLPTERLVEKKMKVHSKDMSRKEFIKLCMDFLKEELPKFISDWKNIGMSCDFETYYSTIDEHSRRVSQKSFIDLYKLGRIERRDAPSMWCPNCRTGVAQVEVEDKEVNSTFNDIIFKVENKDLVIATTRPEFLPACVAIFYNPRDLRYKHLLGKKAKVPLFDIEVPIMEDERAQIEKGTGIVMCCTFGDQTDMEWQKAYNLEIKEAISKDGLMTELAGKFKGLGIKEAREKIVLELKENGLLVNQKPITHVVNVHERCGTEIEFIKSKQWFVKYLDLKDEMLKWGNKLKWHPEFMKHRYDNWVKGLSWDWLISNQRHFGVTFPVWYCEKCDKVILADEKDLPINPEEYKPIEKCECGGGIVAEKDVLNTWFTSSMTPQIAVGLVDKIYRNKLFPMSLRPQSHDIISFWLFNTLLKSQLLSGVNPWSDIAISGFVTLGGEKMSKSKGNIIRPQEVMEKYGADAIRFWAASSKLGQDFDYQEKDVVTGVKFVKKLLNASKFVFMNLSDFDFKKPKKFEEIDRVFLMKLNEVVKKSTSYFEDYEYSRVKSEVENFFWKSFCDNYLEIVKKRIYKGEGDKKKSGQYTLYYSLWVLLRMFAPFVPFITEEIYFEFFEKRIGKKSIHICSWPEIDEEFISKGDFDFLVELVSKIRQEKTKAQRAMNSEINLRLEKDDYERVKVFLEDLANVSGAVEIKVGSFKVEFI